jgi:hypothetical protein
MAAPDHERTEAFLSETDNVLSVLILCPCGEQIEAESRWWFALTCSGCQARYEFGIPPTMSVRPGESRRIRVSVLRE